jgi:hypothetical protein
MSRAVVAGIAGVITAAAAQFLAAMISGGGHAWVEPFFFSAAMWVMFPLMFIRVQQHRAGSDKLAPLDWLVMLLAIALDILLVMTTIERDEPLLPMFGTGTERFVRVLRTDPVLPALWIALWLSWQIAALVLCIRARGGR